MGKINFVYIIFVFLSIINIIFNYITFCIDFIGFSTYTIILWMNKGWVLLLFQFECHFSSLLIVLVRTISIMANRTEGSRHLCLFPDVKRKHISSLTVLVFGVFNRRLWLGDGPFYFLCWDYLFMRNLYH